jgi:hypothetical protein
MCACVAMGCSKKEHAVSIAYSNDLNGEIRSCGCVSTDYGGLGRRASWVEISKRRSDNYLLLDGGDMFGVEVNYGEEKANLTLQAMSYMGYHGIVPGEKDFSLGVDFLAERARSLKLPVLVANVVNAESKEPVFQPSRVVTLEQGLKVGIIGVISKDIKWPESVDVSGILRTDPGESIRQQLEAIGAEQLDIVVVLAHMRSGAALNLVRTIPEIDLIVVGHEGRSMRKMRKTGNAFYLAVGGRGRFMGLAHAIVSDGDIIDISSDITSLSNDWEDHEAVVKLFESYDVEIANRERARASDAVRLGQARKEFLGVESCKECHEEIYEQWFGTAHASAMATLEGRKREYDRDCTPCHVTGFYELGGFLTMTETPELANVQCEACHGAGREHAKDSEVGTPGRASEVCSTCHNEDQSPGFKFEEYWPRISH